MLCLFSEYFRYINSQHIQCFIHGFTRNDSVSSRYYQQPRYTYSKINEWIKGREPEKSKIKYKTKIKNGNKIIKRFLSDNWILFWVNIVCNWEKLVNKKNVQLISFTYVRCLLYMHCCPIDQFNESAIAFCFRWFFVLGFRFIIVGYYFREFYVSLLLLLKRRWVCLIWVPQFIISFHFFCGNFRNFCPLWQQQGLEFLDPNRTSFNRGR